MSKSEPRLSLLMLRLLSFLMEDPSRQVYGFELVKLMGSRSGSIYPLLARLERSGWLEGVWEEPEPGRVAGPRRRFYRLTGVGERGARDVLDEHLKALRLPAKRPAWSPAPQGSTG